MGVPQCPIRHVSEYIGARMTCWITDCAYCHLDSLDELRSLVRSPARSCRGPDSIAISPAEWGNSRKGLTLRNCQA